MNQRVVDLAAGDRLPAGSAPCTATVPTRWGTPRLARLRAELGPRAVQFVPRALAIARSHTDVASQGCLVVEAIFGHWLVHRLSRTGAGWSLRASVLLDPGAPAVPGGTDDVSAVFIDDGDHAEQARDWFMLHTNVGRIVRVDRDLLRRYGGDPGVVDGAGPEETYDLSPEPMPASHRLSHRRHLVVAAVVAAVLAVGGVVLSERSRGDETSTQMAVVGRVQLVAPPGWHRTDSPGRSVFAQRADGRRIIVVQTTLRAGSTSASVARSLANKIAQRGTGVVSEFSPTMRVGGREVIGYREMPASGAAIAWYVMVSENTQVSIGCQDGTAAESVQLECSTAVTSATIR